MPFAFRLQPTSTSSTWNRAPALPGLLPICHSEGASFAPANHFRSARVLRVTMSRKTQTVEALAVVRILKPRIGMGVEFIDVESPYNEVLCRWIEQVRQSR